MEHDQLISLDVAKPIWQRVFTVSPLVVIGTREGDGYNLAPKHMATPMSWENYFGFVCTPEHSTYHNAKRFSSFTVSYPRPDQVTIASLTATMREGPGAEQPLLQDLPTTPARDQDGVFLEDAYLMLECVLDRVIDDIGKNSLIIGRIVAAHAHEDALRISDQDDQSLIHESPLLAYLNPGRYATIKESQAFPFPADFSE